MLKYKGYYAIPQFSAQDGCFHGKLSGISDCIMFEGDSVVELENSFIESVDEYMNQCKMDGIEPQKPFNGKYNLRLPPALHVQTTQAASQLGKSVNQFIVDAVSNAVHNILT